MDCMEKSVKDQAELLAEARKAGKDALDSILELIPEEEWQPHLTPVFPKATPLLAPVLTVARRHTDEALRNIHTQLVDLGKEHIPQEHAGPSSTPFYRCPVLFDRRWTTWPQTRSSSHAR